MSSIGHGVRNAFRNAIKTLAIVLISAVSVALALVMALSYRAVQDRIEFVKSTFGNIITVQPAGIRGGEGGGELLTETDLAAVGKLPHVKSMMILLNNRVKPPEDTTLVSALDPGAFGGRQQQSGGRQGGNQAFSPAIFVTGAPTANNVEVFGGNKIKISDGKAFADGSDKNEAIVGKELAVKNNLKIGSTFTAYGATITVIGTYDAGEKFSNASIVMPIKTVQNLTGQPGAISTATVIVDSISNVESTEAAISKKLGSKADIISSAETNKQALDPLSSISNIAVFSLIGALVAGSLIVFLTMLMIVRERRREIGILKAIGASDIRIVVQFAAESFVLTAIGGLVGIFLGVALSNPVLNTLVTNRTADVLAADPVGVKPGPGVGLGIIRAFHIVSGPRKALIGIKAAVGYDVLLIGLVAIVIIGILGTTIPAWLSAKVRPAEALRSE